MTPLEIVGLTALGWIGSKMLSKLVNRRTVEVISIEEASKQIGLSIREAFQAGMLCAADIVTHSGHEEVAGDIRKTADFVRSSSTEDL